MKLNIIYFAIIIFNLFAKSSVLQYCHINTLLHKKRFLTQKLILYNNLKNLSFLKISLKTTNNLQKQSKILNTQLFLHYHF